MSNIANRILVDIYDCFENAEDKDGDEEYEDDPEDDIDGWETMSDLGK